MASYAPTPSPSNTDVFPTVDEFADALSSEQHWYNLGIFLQVPIAELKTLELEYRSMGTQRCLIELYNSLELLNKVPSWEYLSQALRRSNNVALANDIYTKYVLSSEGSSKRMSVSDKEDSIDVPSVNVPKTIAREFFQLTEQFSVLASDIIDAIKSSNVDVSYLQNLLFHQYNITHLPPADATIDNIFKKLRPYYCLLNYSALKFLTKTLLKEDGSFKRQFSEYKSSVTAFKSSAKMGELKKIFKKTQSALPSGCKKIKLKVSENWNDVTLERFEAVINKIMPNVYRYGTQIVVDEGCIAISWIVSNELVRKADIPIEDVVFQIIGILSLHIDDVEVIYDYQGEGCETFEAAMLQAIELKNTRAIELLLIMGVKEPIEHCTGTAVLPRQQLGIEAKMRVKIITRDNNGKELDNGVSTVRAVLSCNKEECPVTNNSDGTYYVTVIPEQLGQHQLSITIDNHHIQNSPFSLTIVPQRDYTKLTKPVQTITNINSPRYIAFSKDGDMFVTNDDRYIYVYDKSGNKKTTIGSEGSGELQFRIPFGMDINGDIVYVSEWGRHRIHKLTTGGEFISTFGEKGSDINQFNNPYDVKISPDNKVYVADKDNNRVQVFHSDWTISHVINGMVSGDGGFSYPEGIAFDLSGNVHVTGYSSNSVTVFTPSGQFIHQYDTTHISGPIGIAIDPSGYSLVANWHINDRLSVFDPNGVFRHSVGGLRPFDVSVANDGGVWVADTTNNRLVKY